MAFKGSNPFKVPRPMRLPDGWNAETLAGDKTLTIQDAQAQTVVSFSYGDSDPWPERADGSGATLVLIDPGNRITDASYC